MVALLLDRRAHVPVDRRDHRRDRGAGRVGSDHRRGVDAGGAGPNARSNACSALTAPGRERGARRHPRARCPPKNWSSAIWCGSSEGDVVPADGELLELTQLLVDESALTGESLPLAEELDRRRRVAHGAGGYDGAVGPGHRSASTRSRRRHPLRPHRHAAGHGSPAADTAAARSGPTGDDPGRGGRSVLRRGDGCRAAARTRMGRGGHRRRQPRHRRDPRRVLDGLHALPGLGAWRLAKDNALVRRLPECGDAGVDDGHLHRQDRHAHPGTAVRVDEL